MAGNQVWRVFHPIVFWDGKVQKNYNNQYKKQWRYEYWCMIKSKRWKLYEMAINVQAHTLMHTTVNYFEIFIRNIQMVETYEAHNPHSNIRTLIIIDWTMVSQRNTYCVTHETQWVTLYVIDNSNDSCVPINCKVHVGWIQTNNLILYCSLNTQAVMWVILKG